MRSIHSSFIGLAALVLAAPLHAQDCPKETFEYPAFDDAEIVQIVLDHYGVGDPLVPTQKDYDRAATDVALIYDFLPTSLSGNTTGHQPNALLITVADPDDTDLVCLNEYYQGTMTVVIPGWWLVEFPQPVNVPAMASIYSEVDTVLEAGANGYGCLLLLGCCWGDRSYTPLDDGTCLAHACSEHFT